MRTQVRRAALAGNIVVLVLSLGLFALQALQPMERALFGLLMRNNMSHQPHEDIIVVGIDQQSLEELGRYPWDRSVFVPFLENVNRPGSEAKVIAFDIMFSGHSDPASDALLAEALGRYDNVIIPVLAQLENEFSRSTVVQRGKLLMATAVEKPYAPFAEAAELAHINASLDSDGVIRRTWLRLNTPEGEFPSLAYRAAAMAGADVAPYLTYHPQTELIIDYKSSSYDFLTVPFVSVLNGDFPLENFKDAIVLVGFTAVGFELDNGATPVEQEMKLVYAHANIIDQLLRGARVSVSPAGVTLALMLAAIALTVWHTWRLRTLASVALFLGVSALMLAGQFYLYNAHAYYVDAVQPLAAVILAYTVNLSTKSYFETKQKNFITKQFGRYISPALVKEIAASGSEIVLGGVSKQLTILFLDIRGFTTVAERMKPQDVVGFLNLMFDLITAKTLANHGTIDKFIGDAAMLLFNAPVDLDRHEYWAVKTACDIQQGMEAIGKEIYEKYGAAVSVGIGINTGEVVVGNIGSYLRVDYTAIGDHVNTAARIEAQTPAGEIYVSESTYARTQDDFLYEYVGEFALKGKTEAVSLYKVTGLRDE